MADQSTKNNRPEADEIDLGQLFALIGRAFQYVFNGMLRVFLYVKRRLVYFVILAVIGLGIGYFLSTISTKKQKIEVIVKPNLESKNYIYNVISEVGANLKAEDSSFFEKIGVSITDFGGYEVLVEPVTEPINPKDDERIEYLELLQKFENTGIVSDVLRAEVLNRSALNHRITFLYKDYERGPKLAEAVIRHINSNPFYTELTEINVDNANNRIADNGILIAQIDDILQKYTENMGRQEAPGANDRIVLSTEEELNVAALLNLKTTLQRDTERMKQVLLEEKDPVTIINFGKPHQVVKPFFGKKIVLVPLILIALLLVFDLLRYLNRKAMVLKNKG